MDQPVDQDDLSEFPVILAAPDCMAYPCAQECCSHGADVWPHEREALISAGDAAEADFTGPDVDEDGDSLYRTAVGARGCVFLSDTRGCRLHFTGRKPEVCGVVPRDVEEIEEMHLDGQLPCHGSWRLG